MIEDLSKDDVLFPPPLKLRDTKMMRWTEVMRDQFPPPLELRDTKPR